MSDVKTYVAGHKSPDTDSICSAISFANLLTQMGTPATPVCAGEANKETTYVLNHFGFEHPQIVKNWEEFAPEGGNLYLTDHNESKQIIDGYKSMNMCGVVDHHRIGDFETDGPVFMRLEPVGCSNTIITKLYMENNQEIPKDIAGLMLSAIISDTVLFRSPTCTPVDEQIARELAQIAGIDVEEHAKAMFRAGSDLSGKTPNEIFYMDYKKFNADTIDFGVGQITSMDQGELDDIKASILEYMDSVKEEQGLDYVFFMLTNILDETTHLLICGPEAEGVIERGFGVTPEDKVAILPGVMSRKKQMIPNLLNAFQQ